MNHELFIALGALLILVILIDGVRRVRNSRHDRIRVSRRKQPIFEDNPDEFGSELPNGGARVIDVRDEDDAEQLQGQIRKAAEQKKPKLAFAREGVQSPVDCQSPDHQTTGGEEQLTPEVETQQAEAQQPAKDDGQKSTAAKQKAAKKTESKETEPKELKPKKQGPKKQPEQVSMELAQPDKKAPQEVIAFHLRATKDNPFNGQLLLEALVQEGMRYGAMEIFHRHVESDGSGDVLFSIANSVEPGTFDLNTIDEITTPGISFFMDLGAVADPSDAFGIMLNSIAGCMEQLGGGLKDDTGSAITKQTVEHYWQRVRDFERRALSADSV